MFLKSTENSHVLSKQDQPKPYAEITKFSEYSYAEGDIVDMYPLSVFLSIQYMEDDKFEAVFHVGP